MYAHPVGQPPCARLLTVPGVCLVTQVRGVLPASIGSLQWLTALSIVSSGVTGQLPPALGQLRSLKMVWLDHNRGPIQFNFNSISIQF